VKIHIVLWVLSLTAAGCLDFSQWGKPTKGESSTPEPSNPQKPAGAEIVRAFEGAIDHSALPAVSLTICTRQGRQEPGVEVTFAPGQVVSLGASDAKEVDRELREGKLSLVDLLLTARAIRKANFRLEGAEGAAAEGADEQTARGVHDLLLQIVHAHAADCRALCGSSTATCGGRRSFGAGAPCEIAGKTKDEISAHFGADWCASGFCPAMRAAKE
jgi:hypothetical protein